VTRGRIIISTETAGTSHTTSERHPTGDEPISELESEVINAVLEVMTDLAKEGVR
jgi:hypothetical protein